MPFAINKNKKITTAESKSLRRAQVHNRTVEAVILLANMRVCMCVYSAHLDVSVCDFCSE